MITDALKTMTKVIEQQPTAREFTLSNGDCGLVIRKDGRVELFQQQINTAALHKAHTSLNDEERQTALNGQLLMVLSIVANSPEVQGSILSFAVANGIAGIEAANANG